MPTSTIKLKLVRTKSGTVTQSKTLLDGKQVDWKKDETKEEWVHSNDAYPVKEGKIEVSVLCEGEGGSWVQVKVSIDDKERTPSVKAHSGNPTKKESYDIP